MKLLGLRCHPGEQAEGVGWVERCGCPGVDMGACGDHQDGDHIKSTVLGAPASPVPLGTTSLSRMLTEHLYISWPPGPGNAQA